jgi:adenosylhomocysteine nucleosidase
MGAAVGAARAEAPASGPRLAVMSAFAPEMKVLLAHTTVERTLHAAGVTFTLGRLEGHEVVLLMSGVSMVNAAMTAQLAIERFAPAGIVFSGIAGGVDPALAVGDVVVPERWAQYLEAVFAREVGPDHRLPDGDTAEHGHFDMIFPQPVQLQRAGEDKARKLFWLEVDPAMLAVARKLDMTPRLARCTAAGACLDQPPRLEVGGNGVSGSAFVDNAAFRQWTFATFKAEVLDMESAAVAAVAWRNRVPFIAFRSLSDLAGGGPGENELPTFFQLAADNSAATVMAFLAAWQPDRPAPAPKP